MLKRIVIHPDLPPRYRSNFLHFYADIGWFGILAGSAANFLGVYLTRLGASTLQIGLLTASGSVIAILLAIPAARWVERRPVHKATFWTSIAARIFYLLWIPLPWLLNAQGQIWAMITFALLMAIPTTALGVGFNSLFAAGVPAEWRATVAGTRNVVYSLTFIVSSLASGYILDHVRFPAGYQVVFAIGAVGALMSSLHLFFIHPDAPARAALPERARSNWKSALRLDVWRSAFRPILILMFFFVIAQNLALPLFPIFFVRILELTDTQLGIGNALFFLTVLITSTQLARLSNRLGHHRVNAIGSIGMCIYPILLGLIPFPWVYFPLQLLGGIAWGWVGGAQLNYLLEIIPENDRPAYLAWYTLVASTAVLIASLMGPLLSDWMGINLALILFGILRLLAGLCLYFWGRPAPAQQKAPSA